MKNMTFQHDSDKALLVQYVLRYSLIILQYNAKHFWHIITPLIGSYISVTYEFMDHCS